MIINMASDHFAHVKLSCSSLFTRLCAIFLDCAKPSIKCLIHTCYENFNNIESRVRSIIEMDLTFFDYKKTKGSKSMAILAAGLK